MAKVWMVHRESGQYSDWEYDVKGIFSTYEKARAYVESQLTVRCYHYVGESTGYDRWDVNERHFFGDAPPELVETGTTRLVTEDGLTFWSEYPDGERVSKHYWSGDDTWFITEYEVDGPCQDV